MDRKTCIQLFPDKWLRDSIHEESYVNRSVLLDFFAMIDDDPGFVTRDRHHAGFD